MPPYVQSDDEGDVIARAQVGDQAAFSELVRTHQHGVYTLALRLTGDPHMAADVAQEAFVRAWRALPRFRRDAKFSTWMHRIVVNTAWTAKKRSARHRYEPIHELDGEVPASADGPEALAVAGDLGPRLLAALDQLSPPLRTVVVLKDVYDWPHAEIARHLGISETAAKVRLHRARSRLRTLLFDERGER